MHVSGSRGGTSPRFSIWAPASFNIDSSWYKPRPGRSFMLRDSLSTDMASDPPKNFDPPIATDVINNRFTMFFYAYDVASRLGP